MQLIQPVQRDETLLHDIESTCPAPGQVALWWLGQSGYAIKTASTLWYVDLYLSEHLTAKYASTDKPHIRMTEAPLRGHQITHAKWVFSSHKHSDHLDPETLPALFQSSPDARLVLPLAIVDHAVHSVGLAQERLVPTRGDETLRCGTLTVHSIPSSHPALDYTDEQGYPFLGFIFQADGVTIYHSGDTVIYDGLAERVQQFNPDILILPINGTSERLKALHVPPNMSHIDAVHLAQQVKPRLVIPHHYEMFTFNTVDVREFAICAAQQGIPYRVLQCGERFVWQR